MKKIFILAFIIFTPFISLADFNNNLYFGMKGNSEVLNLQQFLTDNNFYSGPINSNFYSLTKAGVIKFQKANGIVDTGYFGPVTRAKVNEILSSKKPSKEEQITSIQEQIKSLQSQLNMLLAQLASEQAASTTLATTTIPSVASTTQPQNFSQAPQEPTAIIISGGLTSSFPSYTVPTTYLGPFSIKNNTGAILSLQQIVINITDSMDSYLNRGNQVHFILRDGTTTNANIISDTTFTFNSNNPQPGTPWVSQLNLSAPKNINQGDTSNYGLWIDGLQYVSNGELKVDLNSLQITSSNSNVSGTFEFVLQR